MRLTSRWHSVPLGTSAFLTSAVLSGIHGHIRYPSYVGTQKKNPQKLCHATSEMPQPSIVLSNPQKQSLPKCQQSDLELEPHSCLIWCVASEVSPTQSCIYFISCSCRVCRGDSAWRLLWWHCLALFYGSLSTSTFSTSLS